MTMTYQFFVFSIYVRILIEVNMFVVLTSASEIKEWKITTTSNIISLIIAIIWYLFCVFFIVLSFLFWMKHKNKEINDEYMAFKEFINGIKNKSATKIYSTIFLLRRTLFVSLLIFGNSLSNILLIILMIVFQIAYLVAIIITRPFNETKNNIIEIANEWYYLVLVSLLSYFNSPDRWSEIIESVYLYIIIANSLTIISVIISKSKHEFNFS